MNKPYVSIIVPVYNVEKYIPRCIESLVNQTLKNIEIILIDDGSIDNSGKICDQYSRKDKRIKVIHKKNEGLGLSRNCGMKIAIGNYIAFVDSDDNIEKNMYELLFNTVQNKKCDACYCSYNRIFKNGKKEKKINYYAGQEFTKEEIFKKILPEFLGPRPEKKVIGKCDLSSCMAIYSKILIDKYKIKFQNEREYVSEDAIFNLEYLNYAKKISFLRDTLYNYYENEGSLTKKYNPNKFLNEKNLYNYQKRYINEKKLSKEEYKRIDYYYITKAKIAIIQEVMLNKKDNKKIKKKNIKLICKDTVLREILKKFNITKLPLKEIIFVFCMKYKLVNILYFIINIKEKGR